jgi:hypothetical protein
MSVFRGHQIDKNLVGTQNHQKMVLFNFSVLLEIIRHVSNPLLLFGASFGLKETCGGGP